MQRRFTKILGLMFIILLVFEIYILAKENRIYYVALGDTISRGINPYGKKDYGFNDYLKEYLKNNHRLSYYKNYSKEDNTTQNIIEDIKYKTEIKKDLRESDLVILTLGLTDFYNSFDTNNLDINEILLLKEKVKEIIPNISLTIKEIRKYAKQKIIIIGYYNTVPFLFNTNSKDLDQLFAYIDEEYRKIADKYNCEYISTYELFKNNPDYLPNPKSIYPSIEGYKEIFNLLIKNLHY